MDIYIYMNNGKGDVYIISRYLKEIRFSKPASSPWTNQPPRNNPSASCELHPKVQVGSVTAGCQDEPWWLGSHHIMKLPQFPKTTSFFQYHSGACFYLLVSQIYIIIAWCFAADISSTQSWTGYIKAVEKTKGRLGISKNGLLTQGSA